MQTGRVKASPRKLCSWKICCHNIVIATITSVPPLSLLLHMNTVLTVLPSYITNVVTKAYISKCFMETDVHSVLKESDFRAVNTLLKNSFGHLTPIMFDPFSCEKNEILVLQNLLM